MLIIVAAILALAVWSIHDEKPQVDIKTGAFTRLKRIRQAKKKELIAYFRDMEHMARNINHDGRMLEYFFRLQDMDGVVPGPLEFEIDKHYVTKYSDFYDILFIDTSGYVFHSIKKETDYHTNLKDGPMASSELVTQLNSTGNDYFTDYEYYQPSDEPAAFFATAIRTGQVLQGWIILQAPINSVNTILTDRQGLGRTGEVYLVNRDKLMLSESRFMEDATILKLRVDTEAVELALQVNEGQNLILDYRGVRVFSSFEKFEILGLSWIIIAEIDEEEVFTDYYRRHKGYFQREILPYLGQRFTGPRPVANAGHQGHRVDINEFARVTPGTVLQTHGVATCTATALLYPDRFGYLAHIAPSDEIYQHSRLTRWLLADRHTDMLGEILRRMRRYDLLPAELQRLQVFIIASHTLSFWGAVDRILANDLDLGNIRILYDPRAVVVNVTLDVQPATVRLDWYGEKFGYSEWVHEAQSLSTIMKKILRYES